MSVIARTLPNIEGKAGRVLALNRSDWSDVLAEAESVDAIHESMAGSDVPYFTLAVPIFGPLDDSDDGDEDDD